MQIQIGPIVYQVIISNRAIERLNRASGGSSRGEVHHTKQDMVIDSADGPDRIAETLLHEILHGIFRVYSLEDKEADESFIRLLSPILLDTLRRNSEVTDFLLGKTIPGK